RVICPDYRGRGRSAYDPDPKNYNPMTYIGDIHHLLTLCDIDKVAVIGTSFGGLLTMGLAVAHPTVVAGAVLNDIGPNLGGHGVGRILHYIGAADPQPDWPPAIATLKRMFPGYPAASEAGWQRIAAGTFRRGEDGMLHFDWDVRIVTVLQRDAAQPPDL